MMVEIGTDVYAYEVTIWTGETDVTDDNPANMDTKRSPTTHAEDRIKSKTRFVYITFCINT